MFRQDFPMLTKKVQGHPLCYLDSAATTLKPQQVIDASSRFYQEEYATVNRGVYTLCKQATQQYHGVRQQVANFLSASSWEEIVFTSGATHALNLVAKGVAQLFLKQGDEVILSEMEHHANLIPWQMAQQSLGFTLKFAPITPEGYLDMDALKQMITPKTKVLSICHLSNTLGVLNPVDALAELAKQHQLIFILDAAQSAAHFPLDVQQMGVDFLVFSAHKLYGPTGVGVLYGRKDLLEQLPPLMGGGDMIDEVEFQTSTYASIPHRFEAGTPMIAQVIALGKAIEFLSQVVGFSKLQAHDRQLTQYLYEKLRAIDDLQILGPEKRVSLVSFVSKKAHPLDVATMLDFSGIAVRSGHHCTQPLMKKLGLQASLRASLGVYNTLEEIDFFISELKTVLKNL